MAVKMPIKMTRRRLLLSTGVAVPAAVLGDALALEPNWLQVRTIRLTQSKPTHRIVHFTDVSGGRKVRRVALEK